MPWPLGKKKSKSQIAKAARARWPNNHVVVHKPKQWGSKKTPSGPTQVSLGKRFGKIMTVDAPSPMLVAKRKAMTLHDIAKEVPPGEMHKRLAAANKIVDDFSERAAKTKRNIMKENRLRGCQFDPAKAPPPIRFVPSDQPEPPRDWMTEVVEQLKVLGCPVVLKSSEPEDGRLDVGFTGAECACQDGGEPKTSMEALTPEKVTAKEPAPQFAALSSKFIAELAFHLAQMMMKKE